MKIYSILINIITIALFLFNCTSMKSKFQKSKQDDTIESYLLYINKYPQSEYADSSKARIEELRNQQSTTNVETKISP